MLLGPYEHRCNLLPWGESGAEVLEEVGSHFEARTATRFSSPANFEDAVSGAVLIPGVVLIPGSTTSLCRTRGNRRPWLEGGDARQLGDGESQQPAADLVR